MKRPLCLFVLLFAIVSFLVQILIVSPAGRATIADSLQLTEGQRLDLTGRLYKKESKNNRLIYYLKDVQILNQISTNQQKNKEGVICYMTGDVSCPIGCRVHVRGQFLPFDSAENAGQFDSASYYEDMGYSLRLWDTKVINQGQRYDWVGEKLANIKTSIGLRFQECMKEENAGVMCAMMLGDRAGMDEQIKKLYTRSGIAHVLSISGLHISFLGMCFYKLLRKIGIPTALSALAGIAAILVYIKMIGYSASAFRAACMFVVYMSADLLNRSYDLKTAMAFSAFLQFLNNPVIILQAAFLLSYLAVLGLAVVSPILVSAEREKKINKIVSNLLSGFSVQVFILPVTLWFYYEFPLCSFFLNLIVIPCMSLVLVFGAVGVIPGMDFALYSADLLLTFCEKICQFTERIPGTVFVTGRPEIWQMILYYILILGWILYQTGKKSILKQKRRMNQRRQLPSVFFPILCMMIFLVPVHRSNRIDMLSIGQGECVCMRDSTGKTVLVDGGSTDVKQAGKYRVIPFLKYYGISKVDLVFLSHAHDDHYSAIKEILESCGKEGVTIKTLCLSKYGTSYEEIICLAQNAGCDVIYLDSGDRISCGKMKFECVYPGEKSGISARDENDCSMVIYAKVDEFGMLFTGDISMECDEEVIGSLQSSGINKIHCLKVAHHGSESATSSKLLAMFDFDLALISCGEGNSYGHPHRETIQRLQDSGCKIMTTAECGAIGIKINKKEVQVEGWKW